MSEQEPASPAWHPLGPNVSGTGMLAAKVQKGKEKITEEKGEDLGGGLFHTFISALVPKRTVYTLYYTSHTSVHCQVHKK